MLDNNLSRMVVTVRHCFKYMLVEKLFDLLWFTIRATVSEVSVLLFLPNYCFGCIVIVISTCFDELSN